MADTCINSPPLHINMVKSLLSEVYFVLTGRYKH